MDFKNFSFENVVKIDSHEAIFHCKSFRATFANFSVLTVKTLLYSQAKLNKAFDEES